MARVYIPGGSTYQNVTPPTKQINERVQTGMTGGLNFFGIPLGGKPVYGDVSRTVPDVGPTSNYGVNDTGRTLAENPNPTIPDSSTVYGNNNKPQWNSNPPSQQPGASGGAGMGGMGGGGAFGGLLAALLGFGGGGGDEPYEAALRERPQDVQNLVSMTRRPGFGQGPGSGFGER